MNCQLLHDCQCFADRKGISIGHVKESSGEWRLSIEYDTLVLGPEDEVYLATADIGCHEDGCFYLSRDRVLYEP